MIEFALMSSMKIRLPKVPAEGLCLIQNGFERNPEGEVHPILSQYCADVSSHCHDFLILYFADFCFARNAVFLP